MTTIYSLIRTQGNAGLALIRLMLAIVIFPHGAQKLFGWFGGYGFDGTMIYFTETLGLPWIIGFLVIVGESLGMILLAMGIFSRAIAASLLMILIGAASTHYENGFFMNFFGNQKGEGVEYFLLAGALSINILLNGAGAFSLDAWWCERIGKKEGLNTQLSS